MAQVSSHTKGLDSAAGLSPRASITGKKNYKGSQFGSVYLLLFIFALC